MINILVNYFKQKNEERKQKNLITKCELQRKKIDFVYRYLLNNYEIQLKSKIDFPAFYYATRDIEQILKTNQLDKAYKLANQILKNYINKETA